MDESRRRVEGALADLRAGRPIIVMDDRDRENEGDLVAAAEAVDADLINFMAARARGLICVAMTGEDLDRLDVPMMVSAGRTRTKSPDTGEAGRPGAYESPFTVSVEAARGVTTGISAADRARTVRVLADPQASPGDLVMPGHVFPLRAHPDGLAARRGHTEAGVELMTRAGLRPAAVICEIMNEDGSMARRPELELFAAEHDLQLISIEDICDMTAQTASAAEPATESRTVPARDPAAMPVSSEAREKVHVPGSRPAGHGMPDVERIESASLPTRHGTFRVTAYRERTGEEHLLLEIGDPTPGGGVNEPGAVASAPVRIHSECLTGDALGSLRCDCGEQLDAAMRRIAEHGSGAIVYLRQEGRGIGLINKIRAYALQDDGMDTVEANRCLGFVPDARDYAVAAGILRERGILSVRLMTNNPRKVEGLVSNGIEVAERIPLQMRSRPENRHYLNTKATKLSHLLETD